MSTSIGNKGPVLANTMTFPSGSAWSLPYSDVMSANDGSYASTTISSGGSSRTLRGTVFGYNSTPALPSNAIVEGIQIDIVLASSGASSGISDSVVQLINGDNSLASDRVGSNKALGTSMPTSGGSTRSYGGSTDLWGATWSAASIRSAIGIDLVFAKSAGSSGTIYIDAVQMTVWYSLPALTASGSVADRGDILTAVAVARITCTAVISDGADTLAAIGRALLLCDATLGDGADALLPVLVAFAILSDDADTLAATAQTAITASGGVIDRADIVVAFAAARIDGAASLKDGRDLLAGIVTLFVPTQAGAKVRWEETGTIRVVWSEVGSARLRI